MSNQPPPTGPDRAAGGKVSVPDLAAMKRRGERITMVTVYDAPSARLADAAGIDVALVGDSAAMTVLGHDSTLPVTMDEMLMLTRAVVRGARRPLVVADMPFGSFQPSDEVAVQNAVRFLKEGGADAVKLEGAGPMLRRAEAIVDAGDSGDRPHRVDAAVGEAAGRLQAAGPYGRQGAPPGRRGARARAGRLFRGRARGDPAAGRRASSPRALTIPTIGIGAGAACDGQVLVWHDLHGTLERAGAAGS